MVVIEGGRAHLNETCGIRVTQVIQTERGKMIFGELEDADMIEIRRAESHRRR
jgi:uncharacterized protein YacL